MATSSSSLDKWRDNLRDINFWLHGYQSTPAYRQLGKKMYAGQPAANAEEDREQEKKMYAGQPAVNEEEDREREKKTYAGQPAVNAEEDREREKKMYAGGWVHWNVGVGSAASFTRAISGVALEAISQRKGPFDHVIKVELKEPTPTETDARGSIRIGDQLAVAVADELGLLDQEEYVRRKEADDELRYYTYGMNWANYVRDTLVPQIKEQLSTKKYLLVVENLYEPIHLDKFSDILGLSPPMSWTDSDWFISTTSRDVCDNSKSAGNVVVSIDRDDDVVVLILAALHQSAEHIFNMTHQEDEQYWHRIALSCFHYAIVLFAKHSPPNKTNNGNHPSCNGGVHSVTSDELIHQWLALGILINKPKLQETGSCYSIYHNVHQVGRVILEAFQEYSLLQLPFSPARGADEATKSAAHLLLHHNLIAQGLTVHELSDDKELERKKWISFVGDQGWHVSREWLRQGEASGPTALILKGCSQQSKLENFLHKLYFLRILDLSYTPIESLLPSIWCLPNLRLLSLRGCCGLKTVCSSSNKNFNLLYLDLSYSGINNFHCDFFQNIPNLQELLLVKCSNLVELPPSIVALSSLTTLEVTGTQIKSFSHEIFAGMQHLQTLKLIDNKLLMSLPRSISQAQGLKELHILGCNELREAEVFGGASLKTVFLSSGMQWLGLPKSLTEEASHGCLEELHIEGWESTVVQEIKLDGHPTLKSFSLISAPDVRCLSLRGCRNLESVDLRGLGILEDLDLSATAIRELPADIPNLPQLRRLLLVGVPSLRRFPWHKLQRLPDVFCLDHCADGTGNHSNKVAHVCVSESRLFYSFNGTARDLVRDGRFFQSFYVRVAPPCMVKIRKMQDGDDMVANKLQELVQKKSPYSDVYCHYVAEGVNSMASMVTPPIRQTEHHVEISAIDRYPHGLAILLEITRSITMIEDTFVSCLSDLSDLDRLEECKLQWCHQMKQVFDHVYFVGRTIQNAWVSYMKTLIHFYIPNRDGDACDFRTLKHLHLEYCPRLEDIMPCGSALPSLTTLDILFCYNVKTIFREYDLQGDSYQLPHLQRIRLQELPQLKHLRDDDAVITAPMWKELHVRGCWSLRRLPRLLQVKEEPSKVEVSGERAWWAKLSWDTPQHHGSYEPKLPQAFASFDERAEVTSYLR